jgi:hypothetical protein
MTPEREFLRELVDGEWISSASLMNRAEALLALPATATLSLHHDFDLERISLALEQAIERERLANMRADQAEEALADTADRLEVCGKMLEGVAEVRDELKAELKQARDLANRETLSANYWKDRASSVSARGALPESLLKRLEAASAEARRLWHHRVSGNHIDSIDLNDLSFSLSELLKDARADNCKAQEGTDG